MILRPIKTIFRVLKRNKLFSFITIGGYAISLAVVFALTIFIVGEFNVDHHYENLDRIYRLRLGEGVTVPMSLLEDIQENVPGIEKTCLYSITERPIQIKDSKENVRCLATNDDFFHIFSIDMAYSSSDSPLSVDNHIILSKAFAQKWYGTTNPLGQTFNMSNSIFTVVGVIPDPEINSAFNFDIVVNLKHSSKHFVHNNNDRISHKELKSIVLIQESVNPESISSTLTKINGRWDQYKEAKISLQPFGQVYFDTQGTDDLEHANKSMIYLLGSITLLILIMTIFNYINLTLSKGFERFKEIGIKKTSGASSANVFFQFLSEALLISLTAFVLAIAVSMLFSPILSQILGKAISIKSILHQPYLMAFILILVIGIGIISGFIPAYAFSQLSPLKTMNIKNKTGKIDMKSGVLAFQFIVTIVLITSVLFIEKQIRFVSHHHPGFDNEMILRLELQGKASDQDEVLKQMLLAHPSIVSVSGTLGSPMDFEGTGNWQVEENGITENVNWRMFSIDKDFLETFGIKLIAGENIDPRKWNYGCLINERYDKSQGWKDLSGKEIHGSKVVGVVEDFHFDDLHHKIGFLLMESGMGSDVLNIKISGNISETIKFIKTSYQKIEPESSINYRFYDDWMQMMYEKEALQAKAVKVFSVFAILIACLGLIGMIEHLTNKKIKEIGIRKVNGAKITEVMVLLNRGFIKWVAIAFIIATPVAYYAMTKWLENFAYKTELSWWIFALAGVMALGIALLTVSVQSWKAATRNPVEALRYE